MRAALLLLLLGLLLAPNSSGSGAPEILIATAEAGISYRLVDWNRRSEKEVKTLVEVEAWSRDRSKENEGTFIIASDDRTSFKAVLDLLRRLKTAGGKIIIVPDAEKDSGVFSLYPRN